MVEVSLKQPKKPDEAPLDGAVVPLLATGAVTVVEVELYKLRKVLPPPHAWVVLPTQGELHLDVAV